MGRQPEGWPIRRFVEDLLEGIDAGRAEAFLGTGEVGRAFVRGLEGTAVLEPYASLLAAEPVTEADASTLQSALMEHLRKQNPEHAASAVSALGKFENPATVPFLRDYMASQLRLFLAQNAVLGNLICALDDCGERILSEGRSCITETEKNIADARLYLGRFGLTFPW